MPYRASLDWLNFLLADVRGGLGPYVSVFLLTEAHWGSRQVLDALGGGLSALLSLVLADIMRGTGHEPRTHQHPARGRRLPHLAI